MQPAAVAVHCAVGVRWFPYGMGIRYCRSAVQKWEEVMVAAMLAKPPSMSIAAMLSPSPMVEQAP